jgi:riboflavin kinase
MINNVKLGIPTANIPLEGLEVGGNSDVESGVYYGWAGLDFTGEQLVYPMVMSIGWNPFYKNTVRSVVSTIKSDNMFHN